MDQIIDQRAFDVVPVFEDTQSPAYKDVPWNGPKPGVGAKNITCRIFMPNFIAKHAADLLVGDEDTKRRYHKYSHRPDFF